MLFSEKTQIKSSRSKGDNFSKSLKLYSIVNSPFSKLFLRLRPIAWKVKQVTNATSLQSTPVVTTYQTSLPPCYALHHLASTILHHPASTHVLYLHQLNSEVLHHLILCPDTPLPHILCYTPTPHSLLFSTLTSLCSTGHPVPHHGTLSTHATPPSCLKRQLTTHLSYMTFNHSPGT